MESLLGDQTKLDVTLDIAASPSFRETGTCLVARRSGLYRSDDGGNNLYPALDDILDTVVPPVTAITVPTDDIIIAAVPGGLLRSADRGSTWSATALPIPETVVSSFATSPAFIDDGLIVAGTLDDGILRSEDGGITWTAANIGLLDHHVLSMTVVRSAYCGTVFVAGTTSGVATSTNNGRSWRDRDDSLKLGATTCLAASTGKDGTRTWLVAGTEQEGLWKSSDLGASWQRIASAQRTGIINAVLTADQFLDDPTQLIVAEEGILYSPDGGTTWVDWNESYGKDNGFLTAIAPYGLHLSNPILLGGVNGGIYRVDASLSKSR